MDKQRKNNFKETLINMNKAFRKPNYYPDNTGNTIEITTKDFNRLTAYEKTTIRNIAKMYGIYKDDRKEIDLNLLIEIIDKLASNKSDHERQYLIALFFPERVRHLKILYPFPVPTYPYIQKITGRITPNEKGAFVLQAICPLLLDTTMSNLSNVYYNNSANLDGMSIDNNNANWTPVLAMRTVPGAFNAYVLQCFKVTVEYLGRPDIQSGMFGAGYFVSPQISFLPDYNGSLFNYIDDSINAIKVDNRDSLNVLYYPLDYSYTQFLNMNVDNVASRSMNTSIRLGVYGSTLPPGSMSANSIQYTITAIWNVIPSQPYAELLPVDYFAGQDQQFDLVKSAKFVGQSKLTAFPGSKENEILKMIDLPSFVRHDALEKLNKTNKGWEKNLLDALKDYVAQEIPPEVKINKSLVKSLAAEEENKDNPNLTLMLDDNEF